MTWNLIKKKRDNKQWQGMARELKTNTGMQQMNDSTKWTRKQKESFSQIRHVCTKGQSNSQVKSGKIRSRKRKNPMTERIRWGNISWQEIYKSAIY